MLAWLEEPLPAEDLGGHVELAARGDDADRRRRIALPPVALPRVSRARRLLDRPGRLRAHRRHHAVAQGRASRGGFQRRRLPALPDGAARLADGGGARTAHGSSTSRSSMRSRRRGWRSTTAMRSRRRHRASASTGISRRSSATPWRARRLRIEESRRSSMLTRSSLTIRLHPDDDVVIARAAAGRRHEAARRERHRRRPRSAGPQGRDARDRRRARRCGATTRSSASRAATSRRASTCTCTTSRWARSIATTRSASTRSRPQYIEPPATFMGIVRRDGPNAGKVATRNYIGILSTVNCSATVARGIADQFTRERLAAFPERRRRRRADARLRLRDGHARRGHAAPAPHARRLREAREFRRRADRRTRLRGEPDQRAARRAGAERGAAAAHVSDPGHRRHGEDDRARRRDDRRDAAARERRDARAGACVAHHRRPAVRRLGRLLRHHRQSGARRRGRSARAPRRHGDPVGDARDLRRRAPADAPRGVARGRREARVAHPLVGGLHGARDAAR